MRLKIYISRGCPHDHAHDHRKQPTPLADPGDIVGIVEAISSIGAEVDKKKGRLTYITISVILLKIATVFLLLRAYLKPSKPEFVLQDITIYSFDVSTPNFITSNLGVTISSRNPNSKIGFYYEKLEVYTTYRNHQITGSTAILPNYQEHKEIKVWTPTVYGTAVPLDPYIANSMYQDQATGSVMLTFKIVGQASWKIGSLTLGKNNVNFKCLASVPLGSQQTGVVVGNNAVKYQMVQTCS